jgi:hypothetical protein
MANNSSLLEKTKRVKRAHERMLLAKPNVVGVGIGYSVQNGRPTNKIAIVVMVSRKLPASQLKAAERIPTEIEGIPVDVQEKGEIHAQD